MPGEPGFVPLVTRSIAPPLRRARSVLRSFRGPCFVHEVRHRRDLALRSFRGPCFVHEVRHRRCLGTPALASGSEGLHLSGRRELPSRRQVLTPAESHALTTAGHGSVCGLTVRVATSNFQRRARSPRVNPQSLGDLGGENLGAFLGVSGGIGDRALQRVTSGARCASKSGRPNRASCWARCRARFRRPARGARGLPGVRSRPRAPRHWPLRC